MERERERQREDRERERERERERCKEIKNYIERHAGRSSLSSLSLPMNNSVVISFSYLIILFSLSISSSRFFFAFFLSFFLSFLLSFLPSSFLSLLSFTLHLIFFYLSLPFQSFTYRASHLLSFLFSIVFFAFIISYFSVFRVCVLWIAKSFHRNKNKN